MTQRETSWPINKCKQILLYLIMYALKVRGGEGERAKQTHKRIRLHCKTITVANKALKWCKLVLLGVIVLPWPFLFNRPGVAGAVLQSPPSLTDSLMVCGNIFKTSLHPNYKS